MKKIILFTIFVFLVFTGCGTKRQYFEPTNVSEKISFSGTLPAKIIELNANGATLENGQFISEKGLSQIKLAKNMKFLGEFGTRLIAVDDCGLVNILDFEAGKVLFEKRLENQVVSASLEGKLLAILTANNQIYLIDIKSDTILLQKQSEKSFSVDYRIASPSFLNNLILYPTLDGKIILVDKNKSEIIRDIVISGETFFNNVIYLEIIGDKMIAATTKRVISIDPKKNTHYNAEIKNVIANDSGIYIFTKDGMVVYANHELKVKAEKKYNFANFSGSIINNKVYVIEKNGYLIIMDLNLNNEKILKLPTEIKDKLFESKDKIFFKQNFIDLNSIK